MSEGITYKFLNYYFGQTASMENFSLKSKMFIKSKLIKRWVIMATYL